MHLKFLELKNALRIIPILMLGWFIAACGMFLTGKPQASWNILKGLAYHFNPTYWKDTLERRKKVQLLRTKSDDELFKTIMKNPPLRFFVDRVLNYWKTGKHG